MGFASLTNLWTLIFPLTVIAYYLFRKRFEPKLISSTLFWNENRREDSVSPFIRNLQRNALFYLQFLALLLFVWMLLGPYTKQDFTEGIPLVFVVDSSATMLATPTDESLFETHQKAIEEMLSSTEGRPVTIIITGKEPEVIVQNSEIGSALDAIDNLTVRYEQTHMDVAIELVKSMYNDKGAEVHIFTDALDRTAIAYEGTNMSWNVHTNEKKIENHSIIRFGASRKANELTAIVKLKHDTENVQSGTLQLKEAETEKVLQEQTFKGEPGSEELVSFHAIKTNANALQVELLTNDDYVADNTSFALLEKESVTVIVDDSMHELLKKAVQAIQEDALIGTREEFDVPNALQITGSESELTKGDRPVFLIGRDKEKSVEAKGEVTVTDDPLFSIGAPTEMYVEKIYPAFEGFDVIARLGEKPLIQRSPRGDIIFLADLESTDWPLQPTFPLFVWSLVKSLTMESNSLGVFTPLQRKSVILMGMADIYDLSGTFVDTSESPNTLRAPMKPGIYKATDDMTEKLFAVQLDPTERNVSVSDSYSTGNLTAVDVEKQQKVPMIWPVLILLVMMLLLEWEVQRRRGYPY